MVQLQFPLGFTLSALYSALSYKPYNTVKTDYSRFDTQPLGVLQTKRVFLLNGGSIPPGVGFSIKEKLAELQQQTA